MASTTLRDELSNEFIIVLDDDDFITAVEGPWPETAGDEFLLFGLQSHKIPSDVPDQLRADALGRGEEVCYYDYANCRICYCDGSGRMRCVKMC